MLAYRLRGGPRGGWRSESGLGGGLADYRGSSFCIRGGCMDPSPAPRRVIFSVLWTGSWARSGPWANMNPPLHPPTNSFTCTSTRSPHPSLPVHRHPPSHPSSLLEHPNCLGTVPAQRLRPELDRRVPAPVHLTSVVSGPEATSPLGRMRSKSTLNSFQFKVTRQVCDHM